METMHTDDLLRLMHAMKETGVAVLQHGLLRLERETKGAGTSTTVAPAPLLETLSQDDDKIPADLELEVRERQLDEMRLMDPFQYEQALLREDIREK